MMEELYTYFGYILIAILIYLIVKAIFDKRGGKKEGFMGIFKDKDTDTDKDSDTDKDTDTGKDIDETEKNEHMTKLEENIKNIQNDTDKSLKKMNLDKTRSQWEELIVAMEDRINSVSLHALSTIAVMIKENPNDSKLVTVMENLNTFTKYKETLKENMKYLDGLK